MFRKKKSGRSSGQRIISLSAFLITVIVNACNFFDPFNPYGPDYGYWAKSYGGPGQEQVSAFYVTADETVFMAGTTNTFGDSDMDGSAWLIKLDKQGQVLRQRAYYLNDPGMPTSEEISDFIPCQDSNYLALINLVEYDREENTEIDRDFALLRLDADGELAWSQIMASSGKEQAYAVCEAPAGPRTSPSPPGYVIAGYLDYNLHNTIVEGQTAAAPGKDYAAFVLKLDNTGNIAWQTILPGSPGFDEARAVFRTNTGDFFVGGNRTSDNNDSDYWLLKLESDGDLQNGWSKTYGGAGDDYLKTITPTSDGGLLLAGISASGSAVQTRQEGVTHFSHWIIKLDSSGGIQWQKRYAETKVYDDSWKRYTNAISEPEAGQYLLALSIPAADTRTADFGLLKLDHAGNIVWQKRYGGTDRDEIAALHALPAGGYLTAGHTRSFTSGGFDFWAIKLLPNGYCPTLAQEAVYDAADSKIEARVFYSEKGIKGRESILGLAWQPTWNITETSCTVQQQAP